MDSEKAPHNVSKSQLPTTETSTDSEPPTDSQVSKWRVSPTAQAWIVLFIHGTCSVALALAIAFGLDGYKAGDKTSSHRFEGKLLLRVSDVTTLVSVALVAIKIIVGVWSTIALWGFGQHMLKHKTEPSRKVLKMIQWRFPAVPHSPKSIPKGFHGWIISVTLITIFIQAFTGPLLTGSVSWNAAFALSTRAVPVRSVDPTATFSTWYWYNRQTGSSKGAYLRTAAGYANLAWADKSTVDVKGKSKVGNGCRSVMNDEELPRNSSLVDATLPCIKINSIEWHRTEDEMTKDEWSDVHGDDLTLVDDDPFGYYRGGVTLVYDLNNLRKAPDLASTNKPPADNKFSGKMTVALMLARRHYDTDPPCEKLPNTVFGDISTLPYLVEGEGQTSEDENCFLVGKIDFTAGVTKNSRATYIANRVIEGQTPIEDVEFDANPWVQDAIWWLPDLLTMIAVSNASLPPAFENLDDYVGGIVRQGYLAAWDMLHHSFDEQGPSYNAFSAQDRLIADVSFARVFAWLGLSLFMTFCGVVALVLVLKPADLKPPKGENNNMGDGSMEIGGVVVGALGS